MYYFAYGSNLLTSYLREYCPSATAVMRANIPNFRVEFPYYSEESQGGLSSIIEAPGELVEGVIFNIEKAEFEAMDIMESVPLGLYRRDTFLALGEDGKWHRADLYRVVTPSGPFMPSKGYLDGMIKGAYEHNLSPEYIKRFEIMRVSLMK
ncbi:MAG: gamma-glutamylcyclotransferase [Chloroflexi bacterium]|nr:gamma-glutamylcyclotransferase [Chloroflexota bacterium]